MEALRVTLAALTTAMGLVFMGIGLIWLRLHLKHRRKPSR
jgi:hypothetical protein